MFSDLVLLIGGIATHVVIIGGTPVGTVECRSVHHPRSLAGRVRTRRGQGEVSVGGNRGILSSTDGREYEVQVSEHGAHDGGAGLSRDRGDVLSTSGFIHKVSLSFLKIGTGLMTVLVLTMFSSILFGMGLPAPAAYVAIACPLTPETEGLVVWNELRLLGDGVLINVVRGGVVDESALTRALQ